MESNANETSWVWFFFITIALSIAWYFVNSAVDFNEISKNWAKYRCNPAVMPFASAYGHNTTENFQFCLNQIFTNQVGGVTGPFTKILTTIVGTSMTFLQNLNSLRMMLATLLGGMNKIIQEFTDRFKLLFSQVRITMLRMQTLFKRVFATMYSIFFMGMSGMTAGLNFGDTFIFKFIDTFCFPPETPIDIRGRGLISIGEVELGDICDQTGARVTSVYRFQADGQSMVKLNDIEVSTNHFVRHEGQWIQAVDHPDAIPCEDWNGGKHRPLVCLDTDTHEIPLGNYIFSDWDETSESDEKTMELAESKVNGAFVPSIERPWLYQPAYGASTQIKLRGDIIKCAKDIQLGDRLTMGKVVGIGKRHVNSYIDLPTGERVTPSTLIWDRETALWRRAGHMYQDSIQITKEPIEMITLVIFYTAVLETASGLAFRDMCEVHSADMEAPTTNALDPIRRNPSAQRT
jgi:hypothetical protein